MGPSINRGLIELVKEKYMCPACIENAVAMVAGVASSGGILAVCIGKIRNVFRTNGLGLFRKTKEN
jgi:hypothetical protein